jgi:hypothetical protein
MLQESSSTTWDLRTMVIEPSGILKAYIFFLLTVCVVAIVKLVRSWRLVPPFRSATDKASVPRLRSTIESLRYWRGVTYQGWGIFASISLYELCDRLLDQRRVGDLLVVFLIREFSTALTMALLVALFLYLVQWHLHRRAEKLVSPG